MQQNDVKLMAGFLQLCNSFSKSSKSGCCLLRLHEYFGDFSLFLKKIVENSFKTKVFTLNSMKLRKKIYMFTYIPQKYPIVISQL